jgi:hypothetical protein
MLQLEVIVEVEPCRPQALAGRPIGRHGQLTERTTQPHARPTR